MNFNPFKKKDSGDSKEIPAAMIGAVVSFVTRYGAKMMMAKNKTDVVTEIIEELCTQKNMSQILPAVMGFLNDLEAKHGKKFLVTIGTTTDSLDLQFTIAYRDPTNEGKVVQIGTYYLGHLTADNVKTVFYKNISDAGTAE